MASGAKIIGVLCRYVQAELIHARFAMLGAAGVLIPSALGFPQWYEAGEKAIEGAFLTARRFYVHFMYVLAQ